MFWEFAPRLGSHSKSCFTFYMQQLKMSFQCSKALLCCFACSSPTCSSEPCLLCVTLYFSETSLCCFGSDPTKAVKTKITMTTRTNCPVGLNHKHLFLLVLQARRCCLQAPAKSVCGKSALFFTDKFLPIQSGFSQSEGTLWTPSHKSNHLSVYIATSERSPLHQPEISTYDLEAIKCSAC